MKLFSPQMRRIIDLMNTPLSPGLKLSETRSQREAALAALEQLRVSIEQGNVLSAVEQAGALQDVLHHWRRTTVVTTARAWLDAAAQQDVLLFNIGEAEQHLAQWTAAMNGADDPELTRYQRRVADLTQRKQATLYIHGVVTYCDSLLAQAADLERSEAPPHPDFVMAQYYGKARAIVEAARAEHVTSTELSLLHQKVERLHTQKMLAATLYINALMKNRFTEVLYDLSQLPTDMPIPRFAYEAGNNYPVYQGMVTPSQARRELLAAAQDWAHGQAQALLQSAQAQLDAHRPQAAQEALASRADLQPYLKDDQRGLLETLSKRADEARFRYDQARERAAYAAQVLSINPLDAWDVYAQAHALYAGLPELAQTRENVVAALAGQLDGILAKAEQAFYDRQMEQVRQLVDSTMRIYSGKDPLLDEKLDRLRELDEMTRQYDEYVASASATYHQVRALLFTDAVAANDLLSQVESYPDLVLEAFPDLGELREIVNRRLNADQFYGQLFGQLYAEQPETVTTAIHSASEAAEEYPDDPRFAAIADALSLHLDYLQAQQAFDLGQPVPDIERLHHIAASDHPDRNDALWLLDALRKADGRSGDAAAEVGE